MKRYTTLTLVGLFLVLALCACSLGEVKLPQISANEPSPTSSPSIIRLVENGDDVKDSYTSGGPYGYDDISLESGMAAAQILCETRYSISAGTASLLNTHELTLDDCPELLDSVQVQIVNTATSYGLDCRHCDVTFDGEWEYGDGISAWRGTIQIIPLSDETPSLFFTPITLPK